MYLLKALHDLVEKKKNTSLEEGHLILHAHVKHGSLLSKEIHLYGSSTGLVEQVESLEDQLRKMENDVFLGDVEVEIVSLIIYGVVREVAGWEKGIMIRQELFKVSWLRLKPNILISFP